MTLVPLHPVLLPQSLALLAVAERVEKGFGRRPVLVLLEGQETPAAFRDLRKLIVSLGDDGARRLLEGGGVFEAWRAIKSLYVSVSRELGRVLLLLPGCSDFLAAVDLLSLLEGLGPSLENTPCYSEGEGPILVNAFYGVPCYEVALAGVLLGGDPGGLSPPLASFARDELAAYLMVLSAISGRSYEVLVNLGRSVKELAAEVGTRCSLCLAPSQDPVCPYCRRLEGLNVRVRWEG